VPIPLILWGLFELGSGVYDAHQAYKTYRDPSATADEKSEMMYAAAASAIGPGGGYTALVQRSGRMFEKAGIEVTDHFKNRLVQRGSRGISERGALDAYNNGRVYFDPNTKNYVRHDSKTRISVVVDKPSGGKAISVFEGNPSPGWQHVRWRP